MRVLSCAALLLLASSGVGAHHSPSMFNTQQRVTLSGTVKSFQWTNPHSYIQLLVKDEKGQTVEWSVEGGAPMYLQQQGWKPSTLKPGDAITVVIAPMHKQGRMPAGLLMDARRQDGTPLGVSGRSAP